MLILTSLLTIIPFFNTKFLVRISMGSITPVQKAHNYLHKGMAILL